MIFQNENKGIQRYIERYIFGVLASFLMIVLSYAQSKRLCNQYTYGTWVLVPKEYAKNNLQQAYQ